MRTDPPQSIFAPHGPAAAILTRLGVTLTWIAVAVTVIMCVIMAIVLLRRRRIEQPGAVPLQHFMADDRRGVRWIIAGLALTVAILAFAAAYSVRVLMDDPDQLRSSTMTVRITGYQYWWKIEYLAPDGHVDIVDANELHLPVKTRVRLELQAGDVIHSFWIPGLAGKTDLIPGQVNTMWLEADQPGTYRGQCAEYCGVSHANMRVAVIAQPRDSFSAWQSIERRDPPPDSAMVQVLAARGCTACHRMPGASGVSRAPDLAHLASRATLAAGMLDNTIGNLRAWLTDPQAIKPGTLMPRTGLTPDEIDRVSAYLERVH